MRVLLLVGSLPDDPSGAQDDGNGHAQRREGEEIREHEEGSHFVQRVVAEVVESH